MWAELTEQGYVVDAEGKPHSERISYLVDRIKQLMAIANSMSATSRSAPSDRPQGTAATARIDALSAERAGAVVAKDVPPMSVVTGTSVVERKHLKAASDPRLVCHSRWRLASLQLDALVDVQSLAFPVIPATRAVLGCYLLSRA